MGLALYVVFANHLTLTGCQYVLIVAMLLVASVAYFAFLLAVTVSHRKDLDWLQYYRDCAACALGINGPKLPELPADMKAKPLPYMWKNKQRLSWSYLPQVCFTLSLLIFVACLLCPGTGRHSEPSRHCDTQVITYINPAAPEAGH